MTTQTASAHDRLVKAMATLAAEGIHAKGPAACCGSCSLAEVPDGMAYAFWNEQGHERAFAASRSEESSDWELHADGDIVGDLHITYGPGGEDDDTHEQRCLEHGRHVARVLRDAGVNVEWDEDISRTIVVKAERHATSEERHLADGDVQCYECSSWVSPAELDENELCEICQMDDCCAQCDEKVGRDNLNDQRLCEDCDPEEDEENDDE
jgi:hypothetical protein